MEREPEHGVEMPDAASGSPRRGPWLAEAGPGLNDPLLDESLSIVAPRIMDE